MTEGPRAAANRLGKSDSLMRKFGDADQNEQMSLRDAAILTASFRAGAIAEFFAFEAGGVFLRLTDPTGNSRWYELGATAAEEFGQFAARLYRAVDPQGPGGAAITVTEARSLLPELDDAIRVLLECRGELLKVLSPEDPAP